MNIHQLSVIYLDERDRILVRFNTTQAEELRLWLTRRLVSRVMAPLREAVGQLETRRSPLPTDDPQTRQMLTQLRRAQAMQQSDFATPYRDTPDKLPLGSKPLVVTQLRITVQADGQLHLGFEERLTDQADVRGFQVAMESAMVHGFMHLLEAAVARAEWGIASAHGQDISVSGEEWQDPSAPKYLQ